MKLKALPLFLALALPALAQTTYTTTANGCGGKNLGYCRVTVVDNKSTQFTLILDHRYTGGGPLDTLDIETLPWPGTNVLHAHGVYAGFVGNPNGTHAAYYGSGSFSSDDGRVNGQFPFYAYWVGTCSGRGCAGAVVGWHYVVQMNSAVTPE